LNKLITPQIEIVAASASSTPFHSGGPEKLFDGDSSCSSGDLPTAETALNTPGWFSLDLGTPRKVAKLKVAHSYFIFSKGFSKFQKPDTIYTSIT
jgi:hypothetical protein